MKGITKLLFLLLAFSFAQAGQACDNPVIRVSNCFGTTEWTFPNYDEVKTVCAGSAIELSIACSSGSVFSPGDKLSIYEVNSAGNETLVLQAGYGFFFFIPDVDQQYRIKVSSSFSGAYYEVNFNSILCLDFDMSIGDDPVSVSCVPNKRDIDFELQYGDVDPSYCYFFEWDFGDGTVKNTELDRTITHSYDYSGTADCKNYTVTIRAIASTLCEQDCPDVYTFTKVIRVCRFCKYNPDDREEMKLAIAPNPTPGPIQVSINYSGKHQPQQLIITRVVDGQPIHRERLPDNLLFPYNYTVDLSNYPPGMYQLSIISSKGEITARRLFKQ